MWEMGAVISAATADRAGSGTGGFRGIFCGINIWGSGDWGSADLGPGWGFRIAVQ